MKKINKKEKLSAFTLIELLVVIAIIGILAGLLFPAIQGALVSAQATKVGNSGANIVKEIIQANVDREKMNQGEVWPSIDKWTSSNEYFAYLKEKNIISLELNEFAGAGVDAAADVEELKTKGVVWDMLSGIGAAKDGLPFIYTRNLDQLKDSDLVIEDTKNPISWADKLNETIKPFGDKRVVTVSKGGAVLVFKKENLTDVLFLNNVILKEGMIKIVKNAESGSSGSTDSEF